MMSMRLLSMLVGASLMVLVSCGCGTPTEPPGNVTPRPNHFAAPYAQPAWSKDGWYIFFVHAPVRTILTYDYGLAVQVFALDSAGIWRVDRDGSGERFLHPGGERLALSRDGGRIAIEREKSLFVASVVADSIAFGTEVRVATGSWPTWNPTGTELAYQRTGGIWRCSADGSGESLAVAGALLYPDWHPQVDRFVAYGRPSPGSDTAGILECEPGSAIAVLRSAGSARFYAPKFSPTGEQIAWVALGAGGSGIWVMDADGSHARSVFLGGVGVEDLAWSPDGQEIAYVRFLDLDMSEDNGTIWVVNVRTGSQRQLTRNHFVISSGS